MAVTIRIYNNATQLASQDLPPGLVTKAQEILGGATNAETAALYLALAVQQAREALRLRGGNKVSETQAIASNAAHVSFEAAFDTAMAE
jgi:hypothetical protein